VLGSGENWSKIMLFDRLNQTAYGNLLGDNSRLTGATSKYHRIFHPITFANHVQPRSLVKKIAYSARSVALFVFTLGIYHLHVRRMANNEWKQILCNHVNNENLNAIGNLETLLQEARTARREQAREIRRLETDLRQAHSQDEALDEQLQQAIDDRDANANEITDLKSQLAEKDSRIASEEKANEMLALGFLERIKELEATIQKLEQLSKELHTKLDKKQQEISELKAIWDST
jgi:hypothetical protein